eukprot:XP_001699831.1 predicted protein [Chlamydomonas reinhardtii]
MAAGGCPQGCALIPCRAALLQFHELYEASKHALSTAGTADPLDHLSTDRGPSEASPPADVYGPVPCCHPVYAVELREGETRHEPVSWPVYPAAGAAQVIPVALTSGAVTGVQVEVDDGLSLALALLNQTVTLVIVTVPFIALSEEAFDQAGKQLGILEFPWLVTRNFTLRLANGVWVQVNQLVMSHFRSDNPTRVPGLDILAPTQLPGLAMLILSQAAIVHPACYPVSIGEQNVLAMIRPPAIPGEQRRQWDLPQPGCIPRGNHSSNGTWIPRMAQCYGIVNFDIDVATYGADMDPATSKPVYNGQILVGRNQTNLCEVLLTLDCVQKLGPLGCYLTTVGPRSNGSSVASTGSAAGGGTVKEVTASPVDGGGSDGGGSNTTLIAALCGSLIGAAVLLALVVAAALLVRRRRLRSRQYKDDSLMAGGQQAPGGGGSMGTSQHGGGPAAVGLQLGDKSCPGGGGSEDTSPDCSGSAEEAARVSDVETACGAGGPGGALPLLAVAAPAMAAGLESGGASASAAAMLQAPVSGMSAASDSPSISTAFSGATGSEQQAPVTSFTPRRADLHMNVRLVASGQAAFSRFSRGQPSSAAGSALGSIESAAPAGQPLPDEAPAGANEVELLPVVLGRGAFGQVVEGMFRGQRVAVKLLSDYNYLLRDTPEEGADGGVAEGGDKAGGGEAGRAGRPAPALPYNMRSFADEVEVLSRVDHPNVVRLLGACLDPPRICLVMERMQTSLHQLLHHSGATGGSEQPQAAAAGSGSDSSGATAAVSSRSAQAMQPMPVCKALHIALGVARGLEYLHPTVLHRDLKPANVLLNNPDSDTPEVKITDFGISRLNHATLVTQRPGAGTPAYLAPECYEAAARKRGAITHRADMYSFGVMLWELLSGYKPWQGYNLVELAAALVCWEHDPLRRPAAAEAVKCLEMALQARSGSRAA